MSTAKVEVLHFAFGQSWLGSFLIAKSVHGIRAVFFGEDRDCLLDDLQRRNSNAELVEDPTGLQEFIDYVNACSENRNESIELPIDLVGTPFQKSVWSELCRIPMGETITYQELAKRLGKESAFRAVANACGANPISVLIPCHRVIRGDGSLAGYRWGVERKELLLEKEAVQRKELALV